MAEDTAQKPKRSRGRRSKLTEATQKQIVQAIMLGCSNEQAAQYAGITESCFYKWLRKGEDAPGSIYGQFVQAVKAAAPKALVSWLAVIERAMKGVVEHKVTKKFDKEGNLIEETSTPMMLQAPQWTAAAWKAERLYPERFRAVPTTQVNATAEATVDGKLKAVVEVKSDDDLKARLVELRKVQEVEA